MKRHFVILCLVLVSIISPLVLAKAPIDLSKPVKITGYLMGSAPAGMPEVMVE